MRLTNRWLRQHYDAAEHFFGVACPLLSVLSILNYLDLLPWTWLLMLWLATGHYSLYFFDVYPVLKKYRPFVTGLFVFGVGVLWPVWLAAQGRKGKLWQ